MPGVRWCCQDAVVGWKEKSICSMVPREAGKHMERTHITKGTSETEDLDGAKRICVWFLMAARAACKLFFFDCILGTWCQSGCVLGQ